MSKDTRIGLAALIVAFFGIAAFYLWPENRGIGWACLTAAGLLSLIWLWLEFHKTWVIIAVAVFMLGGAWWSLRPSEPVRTQVEPAPEKVATVAPTAPKLPDSPVSMRIDAWEVTIESTLPVRDVYYEIGLLDLSHGPYQGLPRFPIAIPQRRIQNVRPGRARKATIFLEAATSDSIIDTKNDQYQDSWFGFVRLYTAGYRDRAYLYYMNTEGEGWFSGIENYTVEEFEIPHMEIIWGAFFVSPDPEARKVIEKLCPPSSRKPMVFPPAVG